MSVKQRNTLELTSYSVSETTRDQVFSYSEALEKTDLGQDVWVDLTGTRLGHGTPPWPATLVGRGRTEKATVLFPDGSQEIVHSMRVTPFANLSVEDSYVSASGDQVSTLDPPSSFPSRDVFCRNWRWTNEEWNIGHAEYTRWQEAVTGAALRFIEERAGEDATAGGEKWQGRS